MARILLVEDNPENIDMLSRRLRRRGHEVIMATDGAMAVEMARSESPDLVLMDMNLPVLDGWGATRAIRQAPETGGLPIIALTAHAMAGDREKAFEAGCNDYHTKPVELSVLLAQMEAILAGRPHPSS